MITSGYILVTVFATTIITIITTLDLLLTGNCI